MEKITFVSFSLKIEWVSKNGVFFFSELYFFLAPGFWVDVGIFTNLDIFRGKRWKIDSEKKKQPSEKKIQVFPDLSEWVDTIFSKEKKYGIFGQSGSKLIVSTV